MNAIILWLITPFKNVLGGIIVRWWWHQKRISSTLLPCSDFLHQDRTVQRLTNWCHKTVRLLSIASRMDWITSYTCLTTKDKSNGRNILEVNGKDLWRGRRVMIQWLFLHLDRKYLKGYGIFDVCCNNVGRLKNQL